MFTVPGYRAVKCSETHDGPGGVGWGFWESHGNKPHSSTLGWKDRTGRVPVTHTINEDLREIISEDCRVESDPTFSLRSTLAWFVLWCVCDHALQLTFLPSGDGLHVVGSLLTMAWLVH